MERTGHLSVGRPITGGHAVNRKIIVAAAAIGLTLGLAACDNFQTPTDETVETAPDAMEPVAPAAEDVAAPAADPSATDAPPVDNTALSPEKRSSEETVKPESETLFY